MCAYRQTLYHGTECASGGADLSDDSDIRQWVVALYFAMTTVTTVGYGDITAHSTVEQVHLYLYIYQYVYLYVYSYVFICIFIYSGAGNKLVFLQHAQLLCSGACKLCTMAVLRQHAHHLLLSLWGR